MPKTQSQTQKILALLADGEAHSHHEIYGLNCVGHSRISELRKRGYEIETWREQTPRGPLYMYRLAA